MAEYTNNHIKKYVKFPHISTLEGSKFIVDNERALLAYEMGLYKTAAAVLGFDALENKFGKKLRAVVACPAFLKEHWEREIIKYCKNTPQIVRIDTQSKERDFKKIKREGADFILVNYELLYRNLRDGDVRSELKKVGYDYLIGDEIQLTQNPDALRSMALKDLADNAKYIALLSGTPIPNTIDDAFNIVSMLYPKEYPTAKDVDRAFGIDPTVLYWMLNGPNTKMLRREISDVMDLPPITHIPVPIIMNKEQEDIYTHLYLRSDLNPCTKMIQMQKALLDPVLIDSKFITDKTLKEKLKSIQSSTYQKLDEIIAEELRNDKKIVIYSSHFRDGVTDKIAERYKDVGIVRIDGISAKLRKREGEELCERERKRVEFQTDPKKRILVANIDTIYLGNDLTAASRLINLDPPHTFEEFYQGQKRIHRPGQTDEVKVFNLIGKYDINPYGSVNEGIEKQRKDKERIITYVVDGGIEKLSLEDREKISAKPMHKIRNVEHTVMSPYQLVTNHSLNLFGLGPEEILRRLEKDNGKLGKEFPALYTIEWNMSYSGKTAKVYKKIIEGLISSGEYLGRKADLASGPAILSHALNQSTTNIDLNKYSLEKGKEFAKQNNVNIVGSIHQLPSPPFTNESFNLAVCSLGLYYLKIEQRENALRESNRILRPKGYFIMTIPPSLVEDHGIEDKLWQGLEYLGLDVIPELSGLVKATEPVDSNFKVHLTTCKKIKTPLEERLSSNQFAFVRDSPTITPTKDKKYVGPKSSLYETRPEICTKFGFCDIKNDRVIALDEALAKYATDIKKE